MTPPSDIGTALRQYRIRTRINQDAIARSLGVSQSQISRWESGRDQPRAANADAIRALVWGRSDPVLAGLMHYVRGALAPLVLFDETLSVVAASPFLRGTGAPLAHFGWLFDPAINPELSRLAQRFRTLGPSTPVLSLEIPYSHEARPWACFGRLTVNTVGADLFAIGELSFVHDTAQRIEAIALRAAARPGMGTGPDRA